MSISFQVGDEVMLHISSPWLEGSGNPRNVVGVIISIGNGYGLPIRVNWSNGGRNAYRVSDLVKVNQTSFKTREEARIAAKKFGYTVVDNGKDSENRWSVTTKEI